LLGARFALLSLEKQHFQSNCIWKRHGIFGDGHSKNTFCFHVFCCAHQWNGIINAAAVAAADQTRLCDAYIYLLVQDQTILASGSQIIMSWMLGVHSYVMISSFILCCDMHWFAEACLSGILGGGFILASVLATKGHTLENSSIRILS
jgi:hypothetical protein